MIKISNKFFIIMQKLFYYLRIYGFFRFIWYLLKEVEYFFRGVLQNSYTPFGEDLIIDKLLGKKKRGFYVDIGAYDPIRFSNTKRQLPHSTEKLLTELGYKKAVRTIPNLIFKLK